MPVRTKGIATLCSALNRSVVYNNLDLTVKVNGQPRNRQRFWAKHAAAYDELMRSIDWNRVMLEASGLHLKRLELDSAHAAGVGYGDEVCPDCIYRALIVPDASITWSMLAKLLTEEGQ